MPPNLQRQITELSARVDRLEQRPGSRSNRGRTNMAGAARYLGISEETLRKRLASGGGPRGARNGRFWSFTYDELDEHAEGGASESSNPV
jgi:hypothetical protein